MEEIPVTKEGLAQLTELKEMNQCSLTSIEGVDDETLGAISEKCKNLVKLTVAKCKGVTDAGLLLLSPALTVRHNHTLTLHN